MKVVSISPLLSLLFCLAWVLPAYSQEASPFPWVESVPFETVEQGGISHYRYGDRSFAGADMLIKDRRTWKEFWAAHTAGIQPPPALPYIDFLNEMVIVTLLGYQTTGGGSKISVLKIGLGFNQKLLVFIEDDEKPGLLQVITNPFHIIRLKRLPVRSLIFEHRGVHEGQPLVSDK
ncbi:MAG: hypothetical protein QHH30_01090 [candidate division NC10 bacterium]|nr:hypothetical protein [candidate division NC10 bacterium]